MSLLPVKMFGRNWRGPQLRCQGRPKGRSQQTHKHRANRPNRIQSWLPENLTSWSHWAPAELMWGRETHSSGQPAAQPEARSPLFSAPRPSPCGWLEASGSPVSGVLRKARLCPFIIRHILQPCWAPEGGSRTRQRVSASDFRPHSLLPAVPALGPGPGLPDSLPEF